MGSVDKILNMSMCTMLLFVKAYLISFLKTMFWVYITPFFFFCLSARDQGIPLRSSKNVTAYLSILNANSMPTMINLDVCGHFHRMLEVIDFGFFWQALGISNTSLVCFPFDRMPTIGNFTIEERKQKLSRYRKKKSKRDFGRKIKVIGSYHVEIYHVSKALIPVWRNTTFHIFKKINMCHDISNKIERDLCVCVWWYNNKGWYIIFQLTITRSLPLCTLDKLQALLYISKQRQHNFV